MNCRHCNSGLKLDLIDLGFAPPSNAYLEAADLARPEMHFPLRVKVCEQCWLVQTEDYAQAGELFSATYAYFSSTSSSWLAHAKDYCEKIIRRLGLGRESFVIEVASNDGYLLKNFVAAGVPCLGIEPTTSTAAVAEKLGVPVMREFFGEALAQRLAREGREADLIVGNNVFAHVPNINDFTLGLATALKPHGVVTLEFPHLLNLIRFGQFDTIYHEHYSYLSLGAVSRIFAKAGLRLFDVEELGTHGGSLRVYGCLASAAHKESKAVKRVLAAEKKAGLERAATYRSFQKRADKIKDDLLAFLIRAKARGQKVVAYGAAAKGNTLLNYAGVRPDLLPCVFDAAPSKQGKYLPGSHIPIFAPNTMKKHNVNVVLVLPWNIAGEVRTSVERIMRKRVKFAVAVPELKIK